MPIFAANIRFLFTELDLLDRFEAAARLGFRGVEYQFPYGLELEPIKKRLRQCELAMVLINQNVFDLAVWCFSGFAALTPLVLAALYWRRATKAGAYASVIVTIVTWFIFFAMSGFGGEYTVPGTGGVMPVAVCWLAGALSMVFVSLATKPPSEETVAKFFH